MNETIEYLLQSSDKGLRLDQVLATLPAITSRANAQRLIKNGNVKVDQLIIEEADFKVKSQRLVQIEIPQALPTTSLPEVGNLNVLYEDHDLIVINKPAGLVVHPAPGNPTGTLVNFLLHHCEDLQGIGGELRPGIVHRLDKDTSGVMVAAKNEKTMQALVEQFTEHTIQRKYLALVWGKLMISEGVIDDPIGRSNKDRKKMAVVKQGRNAKTLWRVIERFHHFSLLECTLETGRTHQIRTHLTHHRMPLFGDPKYGKGQGSARELNATLWNEMSFFKRQALHAFYLEFYHPGLGKNLSFETTLPKDFSDLLAILNRLDKNS